MKINVALAEDNTFLLRSLVEKLSFFEDLKVKVQAHNGADLISKIETNHNVDVVLMDIQMPEMDGIQATEIIKNNYPHIKVIMLTVMDDDQYVFTSILNGADGYLLKETSPEQLHDSIIEILNGGAPMSPSIALRTLKILRNPNHLSTPQNEAFKLTKREIEILIHLSTGLDYKKISENLFISPGTVRKHVENIYRKLKVHNKMEAVRKATRSGLI